MTAYLLRRLVVMIPTFLGILFINFSVLRLQGASLAEELAASTEGDRKVAGTATRYETFIDRFRRTGNDLPVLINTRGFLTTDDLVEALTESLDHPTPSVRSRQEKALWLLGSAAVRPLGAVLEDPAQARLHHAAAQALGLCAYATITTRDLERRSGAELARLQERNGRLRDLVTAGDYVGLAAIARAPEYDRQHRWRDLVLKTGFADFLRRLATGDLESETKKRPVFDLIAERWGVTFWLNTTALVLAWAIAIPLGIRSARRQGTLEDRTTTEGLFLLWSLPSFFVGTVLLHQFCTDATGSPAWFPNRGLSSPDSLWMPTTTYLLDLLWHAALPLVTLTYASFVALSRYLRADLIEQLHGDYIRTARAKGGDDDRVVYRHALPNSTLTLITLSSGLLAELFSGALLVELIFSINGLGRLLLDAALQQDAPLIMGATVVQVGLLLIGILIADLCYGLADPRIRSRYA